jgi:hypothetical protein
MSEEQNWSMFWGNILGWPMTKGFHPLRLW